MSAPVVDAHTHTSSRQFEDDHAAVMERAWAAGLVAVVEVGGDVESSERALTLAGENPLVRAALSQPGSDQASQVLTTRGQQVLELAHLRLDAHVREHWPEVPSEDATSCVDVALRVVLSQATRKNVEVKVG